MSYQQFNLATIRTLAYERLDQNTSFYRTDEMNRFINEALRIWNVCAGFWRGRIDMQGTVASQHWYSVPTGMSYILRVEVNSKPLQPCGVWDLDYGRATWESDIIGVGTAPVAITCWAPIALNLFAIWPASAAGGESLIVDGVLSAPQLTNDNNFVDIGREELEHILDYVEHIASFKQGGQEFDASQQLQQAFLKGAGERNSQLMQSSRFRNWMGLTDERKRPIRMPGVERIGAR